LMLSTTQLEAQRCCWGQRYCWGCRRYMDLTTANYDGITYGYVDNINYPEPYRLPLNYYFNNRCCSRYNYQYLQSCIQYTNNNHSQSYFY
jgi:hypothetical protein